MRPHGSEPSLELVELLTEQFGDFDTFRREFTEKALSVFGSGWAWLVRTRDETLDVVTTVNAGTPITDGQTPLLTCDVWEHAYYIDYRNGRSKYLDEFWKVVDWEFVTASLHGSSQVSHAA
jgi:Fe-Mn family superoxide dismutase